MASNINGAIPIAGTPMYAEPIQANFLTAKNEITALQNTLGTGGDIGSPPWDWSQVVADPANYVGRVIAAGAAVYLSIASGAWPPGYRISDGVTVGGVFPSGSSPGTNPIRIQPPIKGVGRLKCITTFKAVVVNNSSSSVGSFAFGLGVNNISQSNMPMYPYLGVAHDLSTSSASAITIQPGERLNFTATRLDVVDNVLNPGIPNWPTWTMNLSESGTLLYPAVDAEFQNRGTTSLTVTDVFAYSFSC